MNKQAQQAREAIRNVIETKTEKLSDADYLEVLEEIAADVDGMIVWQKEEMDDA